ncbi:uncharacterized protein LOC144875816 [Branchiostoma floridae x Branchiostoma japonicum]
MSIACHCCLVHPVHHRAKEAFSLSKTYDKDLSVNSLAVRQLMRAYVLALRLNLFANIGGMKQTRRLLTGLTQLYNKFGMRQQLPVSHWCHQVRINCSRTLMFGLILVRGCLMPSPR